MKGLVREVRGGEMSDNDNDDAMLVFLMLSCHCRWTKEKKHNQLNWADVMGN